MSNKTPISLLQEVSMRKQQGSPEYDEIVEDTSGTTQTFVCKVVAFSQTAVGKAKSKKDAKHLAAYILLNQLKTIDEYKNDLEFIPEPPTTHIDAETNADPVSSLLDLCIQREWPIAEFTLMNADGESHSPQFTIECRVASIARTGTASSKKMAKHLAAQALLAVIEKISDTPKNLHSIVDPETNESRIRTYRELKKNGSISSYNATKLGNRHKFFEKLSQPKIEATKEIIYNLNETQREKIGLILNELDLKYSIKPLENDPKYTKIFELSSGDFDCIIAYPEEVLYENVFNYLLQMMNLPLVQKYY